jgi:hypothetical protein
VNQVEAAHVMELDKKVNQRFPGTSPSNGALAVKELDALNTL